MSDQDSSGFTSLTQTRVAILGLGLMGGSLALALRGKCQMLIGIDPDLDTLELAEEQEVADVLSDAPQQVIRDADLLVLAAPVRTILRILTQLPSMHAGGPVVMDLGSTKTQIVAAMEALPERFDPLGGHPMCGKELHSLAAAEASLFAGRSFIFTPLARTSERARGLAGELCAAVGAHAFWSDAETQDRWTAATSHLPYLTANALAAVTPFETAPVVGSGFTSTTRVAASSVPVMMDILMTNRENVLAGMRLLRGRLDMLEAALASADEQKLAELLEEGAAHRRGLIDDRLSGGKS